MFTALYTAMLKCGGDFCDDELVDDMRGYGRDYVPYYIPEGGYVPYFFPGLIQVNGFFILFT